MYANINRLGVRPGRSPQEFQDRWLEAAHRQPGFVGYLSLQEQEQPDHWVVVTLWESAEAARGWGQNPDYVRLREEEIQPMVTDWSITATTVAGAELKNVVV